MLHNYLGPRPERSASVKDAGDTLVEAIIAIAIVAIAAGALIGALLTSITSSSSHRSLAVDDSVARSFAESAKNQIQRQSSPLFTSCATPASYSAVAAPTGIGNYTVQITAVRYWDSASSTFTGATCPTPNKLQLVTVVATSPTNVKQGISFVVRDPS